MIEAVCTVDHSPEGAGPGAVIATFESRQDASNRGLEESYPRCIIEYHEVEPEDDREPAGTWDCTVEGPDGCTIPRTGSCTALCVGDEEI